VSNGHIAIRRPGTRSETMANDASNQKAGRREWIGLAVIALPCLLYSMDLTVLNLALPRLSSDLHPTSTELLWIVDIYGFLVAGMLVTMGTLGDRIGRRRLLLAGATAFGLASVCAAFSRSAGMLIAARAVLGVAGATLAPSTLSLIRNMFLDPGERTVAVGVWATSFSVGGAIGPLLGGLLLQRLPWGAVFLLAIPVMALLLVLGPTLLPEYRDPRAGRLDLFSASLSLVAVLSAIFGIKTWARDGLGLVPVASVTLGLGVGALFVRRQRRLADPLIDLGLFRVPAFRVSLATFTLTTLVVFGSYVFVGQYLQLVLGLSPLVAGLWMLPGSVGVIAGSMLAPAIVRRVHPATVMGVGLGLAALGFAVLTRVGALGLTGLVVGTGIVYLGLGPVFTLGTDLIVGSAPPERAGAAAAISETSSELGGALGIAILGSIGTAVYRTAMAHAPLDAVPALARAAARETLGGATAAAEGLAHPVAAQLLGASRAAFTHSLEVTATICAVVSALVALSAAMLLRRLQPSPAAPPATAKPHCQPPGVAAVGLG
jgi:DHA2 family multidrug resistance protein-like MFS transporter